ncbi:MAG: DUF1553 domain-containing protein [Verrucomicrobiota bacterium]
MTRSDRFQLQIAAFAALSWSILSGVSPLQGSPETQAFDGSAPDFAKEIRPILSDKCFSCHGPDEKHRGAGLRLDQKVDAFADRDGIIAFVPGDLEASESWYRITTDDPIDLMPPPEIKKPLSAKERDLIKRWIESGADWSEHWSFERPQKGEVPPNRGPIDHFIETSLEDQNLDPSPPADRRTLLRRLSFDLTGLPPTPEQLALFENDDRPDAVEREVDRLLATPHFGERMALYWLDAARYGDTSVMHADGPRTMWPWRDWVVDSFNRNHPFDQFSIEQIAGDLIPNATIEQQIASGFNRHHPSSDEGGAIPEELRVSYVVDRVKTTSNVWLGLSIECAQCHDHKYDPISHKEYFQFYAYFNNTTDPGMQTRRGNQMPFIEVPDPVYDARVVELKKKWETARDARDSHREAAAPAFETWLSEQVVDPGTSEAPSDLAHWIPIVEPQKNELRDYASGLTGSLQARGAFKTVDREKGVKAIELNGRTSYAFDATPALTESEPFSFSAWVWLPKLGTGAILSRLDPDNGHRGWDFYLQRGKPGAHIINQWNSDALKVVSEVALKEKTWHHVVVSYDGSLKAAGLTIYIDGEQVVATVEADTLTSTIEPGEKIPLRLGARHKGSEVNARVDDIRIYRRALSATEVAAAKLDPINGLLVRPREQLTEIDRQLLFSHYLGEIDDQYSKLAAAESKARKAHRDAVAKPTTAMVMADNAPDKMRMTYILDRGQYDSPQEDEAIPPGIPAALPPLPADAEPNRLSLAHWLFSEEQPLTSRVVVNQIWQLFFGTGIVSTPGDFGAQGDFPSHPELLDWLAVDFRENGWDLKRLIRQIVLSETYRQSSQVRPDDLKADPANRYLARAPRHRLQAEMIRDNALAISGLLVDERGGPGVKPYQPPGLWAEVSLGGNPKFVQDHGDKLYRRSLYTYWKRSAPPPAMAIFDAPNRETCVLQRPNTNTPLQALAAMNDVQMLEAARHLAERTLHQGGDTNQSRAAYAFELATARIPDDAEVDTLLSFFETGLARYSGDEILAKDLLSVGESPRDTELPVSEHAAWTLVASMLLNLDETLTRN